MVKIRLRGGIGNQLFQYSAGRAMALYYGKKLALLLDDLPKANTRRKYELEPFNIKADIGIPPLQDNMIILDGYFQSEKYFNNYAATIREELTLKDKINKIIFDLNSVAIHVRRGDYAHDPATNAYHGLCSLEYYDKSIEFMERRLGACQFYLFSDDPKWAKGHLPGTLISGNGLSDQEELIAMSRCRHQIIANSSFSWWAAWLNMAPEKIVVAPKRWFADETANTKDLIPLEWVTL